MRSLPAALVLVIACQAPPPSSGGAPAASAVTATPSAATAAPSAPTARAGWRRIADIPTARSEVAAAVAGGRVYVIGGFGGGTVVERYDPATDRWDRAPSLPLAVDHPMAASVVERTVYVFGGYVGGRASARSFRLQPGADRWDELAPMPAPRAAAAAVTRGDTIYIVGGADGERLVDNHTEIDHARAHCPSHEVYKGILGGKARAVFNGKIIVRQDAQKTNAKQTNRALLLSDDASINTKPQLEIFADDVKCTHGAAIGQLDEDAIFYLRARGLTYFEARDMLIHAFAGEILDRVQIEPLKRALEAELYAQLAKDLAEMDAV